jgi:predicted glycosyltransferase involved in capsule biosynthesis
MKDLKSLFDFDVVILGCKNRMFTSVKEVKSWLPTDFNSFDCPKVLIEEDYFKYRKDPWIKNTNINLILHRHKTNVIRGEEDFPDIRQLWFPFSVDVSKFYPDDNIQRLNKIAFVGSYFPDVYYYRKKASLILQGKNLLDFLGQKKEQDYISTLQTYNSHLSGSLIYSLDNAKAMEIMACGSILLTNNCQNGFPELFGKNSYVTYDNDFSNLISQAEKILEDSQFRKYIATNALKVINKKHTHIIRCKELLDILQNNNSMKKFKFESSSSLLANDKINIIYCLGNIDEGHLERFTNSINSLRKNSSEHYNIIVSEVGLNSNEHLIKKIVPDCKYYFQENFLFDASVAKNNAVRYLLDDELFCFLDVDIIVSPSFIEQIILNYKEEKKAFLVAYKRLSREDQAVTDYHNLLKLSCKDESNKKYLNSALVVCSKELYKSVNGYDEDYKGWGYRDIDFNFRIQLLDKLSDQSNVLVLHQWHYRNFINQDYNKNRYQQRVNECKADIKQVGEIKGLYDFRLNTRSVISSGDPIDQIKTLLDNDIKVCLLKSTCYDALKTGALSYPLCLGVNNLDLAKKLLNDDRIFLEYFSNKTKKIKIHDMFVNVPLPVISYLKNFYPNIEKELK